MYQAARAGHLIPAGYQNLVISIPAGFAGSSKDFVERMDSLAEISDLWNRSDPLG